MMRTLRAIPAIIMSIVFTGCGGGNSSPTNPTVANATTTIDNAQVTANHNIVPRHTKLEGKTLEQWVESFWQYILPLSGPFWPNPLYGCNGAINVRPIVNINGGNVWYWQTPILALTAAYPPQNVCDESANVIPANTYLLLGALDSFSTNGISNFGVLPFSAPTATTQHLNAKAWADLIQNLSITIDNANVTNIQSYRVSTGQFTFAGSPLHSLFPTGNYTAEANGYYLIIKPLPAGSHTIHVEGTYNTIDPAINNHIDMTLLITVSL
jgi:hypothetical protein